MSDSIRLITVQSMEVIRNCLIQEYGEENINKVIIECSTFDKGRTKDFVGVMEYFAIRYGVEIEFK